MRLDTSIDIAETDYYDDITLKIFKANEETFEKTILEANIFRRSLLSAIDVFMIDQFSVFQNNSCISDSHLAMIFSLLPLKQRDDYDENTPYEIDWKAEDQRVKFTTKDIKGLNFTYETPIIELNPGEQIHGILYLKESIAAVHCKWKPVGPINWKINNEEEFIEMKIRSIKIFEPEILIQKGLESLEKTLNIPPTSFYYILAE